MSHKILDGLTPQQRFYQKHKEEIIAQRKANPEYINTANRKSYFKHREKRLQATNRYKATHKEEIKVKGLIYRKKNRAKINQHNKSYKEENKEKVKLSSHFYYENNKTIIKEKTDRYTMEHYEHLAKCRTLRGLQLKTTILTYYGNGKPQCVMCGFNDIRALSIDHINGGGATDRNILKRYGHGLYRWLLENDYPEGYQTLCMNCQWIKKEEKRELYNSRRTHT